MGAYTKLAGEDAKLEGVPRITKASSLATDELLSRSFPAECTPPPPECTMLDMGSGYGGTARVAAKRHGLKVRERVAGERRWGLGFDLGTGGSS